jgi:hypothetical protein
MTARFASCSEEVPLEHFHFGQRWGIFEIGGNEGEQELGLRVPIHPKELDEDT